MYIPLTFDLKCFIPAPTWQSNYLDETSLGTLSYSLYKIGYINPNVQHLSNHDYKNNN